jgi:hypothetical protein
VHQGLRRQDQDHGRLRRALRPRLGLPRPAHRDQSRRAARPQEARDGSHRRPPRLPRVRAEVRRPAALAVRAHRRLRPLGRIPTSPCPTATRPASSRPSTTSSKGLRLQGPQAGLLVHPRPHRPRRSRGRVRAAHLAQRLRPLQTHQRSGAIDPALAGQRCLHHHLDHHAVDLPASQAVAFNPELEYVALNTSDGGTSTSSPSAALEVIARATASDERRIRPSPLRKSTSRRFPGSKLERATFQHPFLDRRSSASLADYVTADQGTGAVHTAPAHGVDDFATGKRYDLPETPVRRQRRPPAHTRFRGTPHSPTKTSPSSNPTRSSSSSSRARRAPRRHHFEHSYPHCWRCHNPVIVRATEQWFIGMETPMLAPGTATATSPPSASAPSTRSSKVVWDPAGAKSASPT